MEIVSWGLSFQQEIYQICDKFNRHNNRTMSQKRCGLKARICPVDELSLTGSLSALALISRRLYLYIITNAFIQHSCDNAFVH
jgi:hypothetical protein